MGTTNGLIKNKTMCFVLNLVIICYNYMLCFTFIFHCLLFREMGLGWSLRGFFVDADGHGFYCKSFLEILPHDSTCIICIVGFYHKPEPY